MTRSLVRLSSVSIMYCDDIYLIDYMTENAGGSGDGDSSEGWDEPEDDDEPDQYNIQFSFKDDDGVPYRQTRYIAKFADGSQVEGVTDDEGYTESFNTDEEAQDIDVRLLSQNIDMILGGVNE